MPDAPAEGLPKLQHSRMRRRYSAGVLGRGEGPLEAVEDQVEAAPVGQGDGGGQHPLPTATAREATMKAIVQDTYGTEDVLGYRDIDKPAQVPVRGMDLAGQVEAVGGRVTRFRPGDAVFAWTDGSYAEYASVPQDQLVPMPANLGFEPAAAVPISGPSPRGGRWSSWAARSVVGGWAASTATCGRWRCHGWWASGCGKIVITV